MRSFLRAPFVVLVFVSAPAALFAQATYTAQLTGTVTDSSTSVVPGAKVILTDEASNIAATTGTNARGVYVFTGLRPASYAIRVEANNFAALERKLIFHLPPFEHGAVAWLNDSK